jgi:hypothetical protein
MLIHRGRTIAHGGISMSAQIRQDDTVASGESLSGRQPELMIRGKRMEQDYGRAFA